MLKQSRRQFLIAKEAPVIQNALYTLLAGSELRRDVTPSIRERLEAIAKEGWDSLILDLRAIEEPLAGDSPRVRNIRIDPAGKAVIVTCEVAAPQIARQTEEFSRPHFFPKHLGFSLGAFAYALYGLF